LFIRSRAEHGIVEGSRRIPPLSIPFSFLIYFVSLHSTFSSNNNNNNKPQDLKKKGVSVSALLAKAVAITLEKHPLINAAYDPSGGIKYNKDINVAMAVALDGGLITPTLTHANDQDIYSLARSWKDLVVKAKEGRLSPPEYNSGTFLISNLGMMGVSQFDALLPVGMGAIMAVGSTTPTVVVQKNGFMGVQKLMTVTLTADHRHIYGADSAQFLKDLAELIENDCESLTR
jgi:pyruvate dehydrogenase E2 component (dihydrolipoamide acetyltransferase)